MRYLLLILFLVFGCTYEESTKVIDRHENGKPRTEMTTKDGEIILMVRYFDNGNIQSIQNRKDGKLHGESIVYDINGNISTCNSTNLFFIQDNTIFIKTSKKIQ